MDGRADRFVGRVGMRGSLVLFAGALGFWATPALAADDGEGILTQLNCGSSVDPKIARQTLSEKIVTIDQGLLWVRPTADTRATLLAQSRVTNAALAKFNAWQAAEKDYVTKRAQAEVAETYLAELTSLEDDTGPSGVVALGELAAEQKKERDRLVQERDAAGAKLCEAYRDFDRHFVVVKALDVPQVSEPADATSEGRRARAAGDCIEGIENPKVQVDFAGCLLSPIPVAEATSVPVPDRPLRPRGFTASFSGSKNDSELALQFANEYKLRRWDSGGGQRFATWGFSTGLAVDGGALLDFDKDGARNDTEFESGYDRIGAGTKLTGSLSLNVYSRELPAEWRKRALKVRDAAYIACQKDRAANPSAKGCTGNDLREWIVERNDAGIYKHKEELESYSNLYFGGPKGVTNARWGALLNGEIARPSFTYKLNGMEKTVRRWDWSAGGSLYGRLDLTTAWDLTGVASLTYKHDWRDYVASDKALDKTQGPVLDDGLVPAIEARLLYRGGPWWPATALLPKLTFNIGSDRNSIDVPLLFLFGEKMDSSAGLKYTHAWGGRYDDGLDLPGTHEIGLVYQKTFSLNP